MQVPPTFQAPIAPPPPPGRVRFDAIGEAWRWYMADVGNWILGFLLVVVILAVPTFIIQLVLVGVLMGSGATLGSQAQLHTSQTISIWSALIGIPINIFVQLLTAGLQRRALLQVRGIRTDVGEIFRLNGMGVHVLMFNVFSVLIVLPIQIFTALANNPSQPFGIFQPANVFAFCGLGLVLYSLQLLLSFTPLIIVDQQLPVGQAIAKSFKTFLPQFFPLLGVMIVAGLLAVVGVLACGIGVLFTAPVIFLTYGVVYNDFFRPMQVAPVEGEFGAYPRPPGIS